MEDNKLWLNPNNVTNKADFAFIEEMTTCPICLGILVDPVECSSCGNCFCNRCYEKFRIEKNTKDCIYKCKNIETKQNKIINKILAKIKFKCENGCGQEIEYFDLKSHYAKTCPKMDYKGKLLNLVKSEDIQASKIKEYNLMLRNIKKINEVKEEDRENEFKNRMKDHPNYNKFRYQRQRLPFGIRALV